MHQEAELIRRSLKTPRDAAIAGIIFSQLMITSQALMRLSIPSDPLASPLMLVRYANQRRGSTPPRCRFIS